MSSNFFFTLVSSCLIIYITELTYRSILVMLNSLKFRTPFLRYLCNLDSPGRKFRKCTTRSALQ